MSGDVYNMSSNTSYKVCYKTDFEKLALQANFDKREWKKTNNNNKFNFYWVLLLQTTKYH